MENINQKEGIIMRKITISVLSVLSGILLGGGCAIYFNEKLAKEKLNKVDKFKGYYNMLNQWLSLKNDGKSLVDYFITNNYKNIAIYGMGEMGIRLMEELENSSINILYGIDKEAGSTYSDIDVLYIDDDLKQVDVIVVTSIFAFEEIEKQLTDHISYPIISLEEVVFDI